MIYVYLVGLFMAGCTFQSALDGDGLFGVVPLWLSAVLSLVAALGWASAIAGKLS